MSAPKQSDPQFKLRMTPEIKEKIEQAARDNNRSMNAEILARLEDSFNKPKADYNAVSKAVAILEQRTAEVDAKLQELRKRPPNFEAAAKAKLITRNDEAEREAREEYAERSARLLKTLDQLESRMAQLDQREKEMIETIRKLRREEITGKVDRRRN